MKMSREGKKLNVPELMVVEKRKELAEKIAALTRTTDELPTAIPELILFRRTTPAPCYKAYEPSLTLFVQGRKRINLGGEKYLCDRSSFLLSSIDVSV
jgi:AraC-type transcriptional regulator N-terminus